MRICSTTTPKPPTALKASDLKREIVYKPNVSAAVAVLVSYDEKQLLWFYSNGAVHVQARDSSCHTFEVMPNGFSFTISQS